MLPNSSGEFTAPERSQLWTLPGRAPRALRAQWTRSGLGVSSPYGAGVGGGTQFPLWGLQEESG